MPKKKNKKKKTSGLTEEKLIAIRDSMPSVDSLDGKPIPEDDEFNKHFKGAWC